MLKVENLSIHFEDRSEREEVVKNVSFAVENGDILGIVGESGSGKTMTALTIAGLLKKHAVLDSDCRKRKCAESREMRSAWSSRNP